MPLYRNHKYLSDTEKNRNKRENSILKLFYLFLLIMACLFTGIRNTFQIQKKKMDELSGTEKAVEFVE